MKHKANSQQPNKANSQQQQPTAANSKSTTKQCKSANS
jgi:hypothetical protein